MGAQGSTTVPAGEPLSEWQPPDMLSLAMGPNDEAVTLTDICLQASERYMSDNSVVIDFLQRPATIEHLNRGLYQPSSGARSWRRDGVSLRHRSLTYEPKDR